ncbi:arginine--tRNA ligase, chloroplastic/mitochondrial [Artemisia annua]|uniref:arginine--tRNA ligase n=1 Tax=Artemisia annua TaxID=35608 RepID=A0A2U1N4S1_ARTAN|nr:arginine--tRNA ligase, chloroplastic/mitochondrial [Artemisia annua]
MVRLTLFVCFFSVMHVWYKGWILKRMSPSTSTMVTCMSRLDISTSDVDDSENRCKRLEAMIEPLIQKLEGITGYNGTGRYRRRRILERRRSKVKREISKLWKELILLKQEPDRKQHKRWSVNEEVENLFNVSLRLSFPELKDEESVVVFSIREYGEYHCEDVLTVWPRLRKEGKMHLRPRTIGWQIKKNLQVQQSEMIEGEPWVHDIGFVTINLSGKWMAKGNTYLYLLNTRARNRSFTKKHRKDIDELKKVRISFRFNVLIDFLFLNNKLMDNVTTTITLALILYAYNWLQQASELTLGEGEIWEEGEERVLALHLLKFNQVIAMSCYPVLPHKLCEYLYDLSLRFNSYCYSSEDDIARETKLLLCEATEVVMEKCFQLLGITPESSSFGEKDSLGLTKSLLQLGRFNHMDPPRKPNPRFELFSVYIHITRDPELKECKLFGLITISDTYGVLYDGWGLPAAPDLGAVALFDCNWDDQIDVTNHERLYLGDPSSSHLIPLSSYMEISFELYATTVRNDSLFVLSQRDFETKFAYFWKMEAETNCDMECIHGMDGDVEIYYVLLKDAIDCTIEVTYDFKQSGGQEVYAQIYACYGDFFDKNEDPFVKNFYTALLYKGSLDSKIAGKAGKVPLKRSMMAVPAKGSIEIKARLFDVDSQAGILDGICKFPAQPGAYVLFRNGISWIVFESLPTVAYCLDPIYGDGLMGSGWS